MAYRNLADSLIELDRLDGAVEALDKAETLEPDAPYLAAHRAALFEKQGDLEDAAKWARLALQRKTDWDGEDDADLQRLARGGIEDEN